MPGSASVVTPGFKLLLCGRQCNRYLSIAIIGLLSAEVWAQDTVLPFVGSDTVTVQRDAERPVRYQGRIEDISGETLILRRSYVTRTQVFRVSQITELTFVRSSDFDAGLQQRQAGNFAAALRHFDTAVKNESREWAQNELHAAAAKTCIQMGDRDAAVGRIETILESDARSRHASLLPLVWDERLSAEECVSATKDELQQASPARQLVAASRLLGNPQYAAAAGATLQRLSDSAPPRIAELATAQLWRVGLQSDAAQRSQQLPIWQRQLRRMPLEARGGPQYVIARGLQSQHDYDQASVAFLWLPFMSPTDEALAAMSLLEAARCLTKSGRVSEAATAKVELSKRFPKSSAFHALQAEP